MPRRSTARLRPTCLVVSCVLAFTLSVSFAAQAQRRRPSFSNNQSVANKASSLGFTFLKAKSQDSGGQLAWTLAVADLNGDGKLDVAVVNYGSNGPDGTVGVLLGNGDGTLRRVVAYDAGGAGLTGIVVGDLNGDGKPDLVASTQGCRNMTTQCVGVLLGNGDGTFQPVVTYPRGGRDWADGPGLSTPVMIADVNGDGKPDLIVINQIADSYGDGLVGVLLGNGDGTFQPVVTYDTGGFGAFTGSLVDVNGDGKPDIVVLNCSPRGSSDCSHNAKVGVLLGNADGTFQNATTYDSGGIGGTSALVVADVNGDGKPDVIVGNNEPCSPVCSEGSFGVLLGEGDGTFQGVIAYDLGVVGSALSIAVADLNGDGKMDLVIAGGADGVWLGTGDGTFQVSNIYPNTGGTGQVLLADLNKDGNLDLVGINATSNSADVRLGNGDGTFQTLQTFNLGGKQISWGTIADVNGDGRPDL